MSDVPDPKDQLLSQLNSSGYPLQIAVTELVGSLKSDNGWTTRYLEHAWVNAQDKSDGFIDVVLQDKHKATFLVVECKRVREAAWVFCSADGSARPRRVVKTWVTLHRGEVLKHCGWQDVTLLPESPQALFCSVRGEAPGARPVLERVASELVSSTEALALQERDLRRQGRDAIRFYFSVIVTTADLFMARFNPKDISLVDGTIEKAESIDQVPFVRLRKQLSLTNEAYGPSDYDNPDWTSRRERTVFVVNVKAFSDFLAQFDLSEDEVRVAAYNR